MKYLLLIYCNPTRWEHPLYLHDPAFLALPEDERAEIVRRSETAHREIADSGELLAGVALAEPGGARTVRVRGGAPVTTDGPYLEAKEHLAGYFVLECDSGERAVAIAASSPAARFGAIEVRPIGL